MVQNVVQSEDPHSLSIEHLSMDHLDNFIDKVRTSENWNYVHERFSSICLYML